MTPASPDRSASPSALPERWWTRSALEVEALLAQVRWRDPGHRPRAHAQTMEHLLRHHPSLLRGALEQGLQAGVTWPAVPDGPCHSALWHALRLSTPEGVQALRARWALLNDQEVAATGPLALTMLALSRNPSPDSPLAALTPAERFAREAALLERFTAERHGLNENGPVETFHDSVARRLARNQDPVQATTLQGAIEHGLALHAVNLRSNSSTAFSALRELFARGDPSCLATWLEQGLVIAQGPGDDRAVLDVIAHALRRPNEASEAWVARQAAMIGTMARHGWTAGPRFRVQALGHAVRHGADPALLPVLLGWGAQADGVDPLGRTALHHASNLPQSLVNVVPLLELGLDPMAQDRDGQTAIGAARDNARSYPGAHEAYAAAVVAMERAVLRSTLAPGPASAAHLADRPVPTAPLSRARL